MEGLLGLAPTIHTFILFRFFQGSGAAMVTATRVAILSSVIPPARRGRAMGIVVILILLGIFCSMGRMEKKKALKSAR